MSFWSKIAGTLESWFGLDGEEDVAIGRDSSGNMIFKDEIVSGTKTLTQLLEVGAGITKEHIVVGDSVTVPDYYQYLLYQELLLDGVIDIEGTLVIL